MSVQSGQSVTVLFTTRVASTSVGTNADSLPTGALYVNGVVNAAVVTVTNLATGIYKAQVTLPTLAIADEVELAITATVSTITDSSVVWGDTKDLAVDASGDVTFNNTSIATVTSVSGSVGSVSGNVGGNVVGSVASVTNPVTVGTINAGVITATSIAAAALNGKGDWLLASSYVVPPTTAQIATAIFTDLMSSSDMNTAGSFGALVKADLNAPIGSIPTNPLLATNVPANFAALGISLGGHISNVDTLTTYTGNTPQTGDLYGRYTTAITESYAAKGAQFTLEQAACLIVACLTNLVNSGTTKHIKKLDGVTDAATLTYDSSTTPTQALRAT